MKVMSYNIQHGVGMDGQLNLERIATVIKRAGATVIGLQEVDRFYGERSHFQDQVQVLADLLDYHYCYGANLQERSNHPDFETSAYGLAILSQHPIQSEQHTLLNSFGDEQRGVLKATIVSNNETASIYNTHLGLDGESRQSQVHELIDITKADTQPCILLGDFNARPDSPEIQSLLKLSDFNDPLQGVSNTNTFPANEPKEKIDYIFTTSTITTTDPIVIRSEASDHLPLMVTCQVR